MPYMTFYCGYRFKKGNHPCYLQHQTLLSPPAASTTEHYLCFGPASSFFLEVFFCSSPVSYWTCTHLGWVGRVIFQDHIFLPLHKIWPWKIISWGSQGKNTEVVCHSLLKWTTFCCQNSSVWPVLAGPTSHGS